MSINVKVTTGNFRARAAQAAEQATKAVMAELYGAFQQSFTAKAWAWPRQSERSNGSMVGSPRNLIDTANLRQSGSWQMIGPYTARFTWSANYATAVHEGAMIYPWGNRKAQRVQLPPRPWTRAVLGQENVSAVEPYDINQRLKDVWLVKFKAGS